MVERGESWVIIIMVVVIIINIIIITVIIIIIIIIIRCRTCTCVASSCVGCLRMILLVVAEYPFILLIVPVLRARVSGAYA